MRAIWLWVLLTLGYGAALTGCGQKGPLFIPNDSNPPANQR